MPTAKQLRAAELISENIKSDKPKPVQDLLIEAGYSESTAARSTQVTRAKSFVEILERAGVTDDKLSKVLEEGLGATKPIYKNNNQTGTIELVGESPDHAVRHKYLETAVKIKGHIKQDGQGAGDTYNNFIQVNNLDPNKPESRGIVDMTLETLMAKTKRKESDVT